MCHTWWISVYTEIILRISKTVTKNTTKCPKTMQDVYREHSIYKTKDVYVSVLAGESGSVLTLKE